MVHPERTSVGVDLLETVAAVGVGPPGGLIRDGAVGDGDLDRNWVGESSHVGGGAGVIPKSKRLSKLAWDVGRDSMCWQFGRAGPER